MDIDEEAARFQKISLQNHGMPPGVFTGPDDLSQEQYEQGKQWVEDQSGPEQARKPWILGGFKFQSMGQTPHELDFMNSRKATREEIFSAYAVPPPMVGVYDGSGGLNADIVRTARRIFWLEGLIPVLRQIESQMNLQLPYEWQGDNVRVTYDISNVEALADDDTAKLERASKLWGMGVPLSEINRLMELGLDLDQIPGSDVGYLPSGLLPADFDISSLDNDGSSNEADAEIAYGSGSEEEEDDG